MTELFGTLVGVGVGVGVAVGVGVGDGVGLGDGVGVGEGVAGLDTGAVVLFTPPPPHADSKQHDATPASSFRTIILSPTFAEDLISPVQQANIFVR